ncbi:phosphatase PAP2 family protein [Altererythrobacter confluentis]|uniref:Phosphatase PAP2 family protein n=1 Tax=Allopontixanthobacter confluentis TaxID=1849021 RepID=A0A6L7GDY3_9SPHN|nr:phosphatase PAP2 family protein [Allopontixanthobacter confluentis]MXP14292.1 phosphatase PAP2 family protein [Allopontixanthobacter confluentis]
MEQRITDQDVLPAETLALPRRGWRINPVKAVVVTGICWTGFAMMAWLVHHNRTTALDHTGLLFWRNAGDLTPIGSPMVLEALRDMTALGGTLIMTMMVLAAITALLFLKLRREAFLLAITAMTGTLVEVQMKLWVGRARPEIVPHLTEAGGMSFPSGHSFNSAMIYIAIALAFATMSARHSVRYTIVGVAIALSMLIATSRVWLGVHFPSDVIAGWLGGAGWAFLASALFFQPAKAAAESHAAEKLDVITEKGRTAHQPQ